jgi:hypothetical protein
LLCRDQDADDTIHYRINTGDDLQHFEINDTSGQLTFAVDYDIDEDNMPSTVLLELSCVDSGGLSGTTTVTVHITDRNDNCPVFTESHYTIEVNSSMPMDVQLLTLNATDADSDQNGAVSYSVLGKIRSVCNSDSFSLSGSRICDLLVAKSVSYY